MKRFSLWIMLFLSMLPPLALAIDSPNTIAVPTPTIQIVEQIKNTGVSEDVVNSALLQISAVKQLLQQIYTSTIIYNWTYQAVIAVLQIAITAGIVAMYMNKTHMHYAQEHKRMFEFYLGKEKQMLDEYFHKKPNKA